MEDLERALKVHPFLHDLREEHVRFLIGCTRNVRFAPGDLVLREGEAENALFLVRQGTFALEASEPGRPPTVVETLQPGDALGVSWMTRPERGGPLDCRARESVVCFRIDGDCLKQKMEDEPALGYAIASRLLERTYERLSRARIQKLDLYR